MLGIALGGVFEARGGIALLNGKIAPVEPDPELNTATKSKQQ